MKTRSGIWINRFRLFANRAALAPGKIEIVVLASLVLHNTLRTMSKSSYTPTEFVDHETDEGTILPGSCREEVSPSYTGDLQCELPTRATDSAEQARNKLKDYFMGPGQVPWQGNVYLITESAFFYINSCN